MIFSRVWYLALSIALAGAAFLLFLATKVSNSSEEKSAARLLTAASHATSFYLKDDGRGRESALLAIAMNADVTEGLKKASLAKTYAELAPDTREKAQAALKSFREEKDAPIKFDALFAVDQHGRVLATSNFGNAETSEGFELGGYALVADALHGWIRDDVWVLGDYLWRVVARPVEVEAGAAPVGAVIGGRIIDESFAQAIAEQTGVAIVFFANGKRVARGAPPSFNRALLELKPEDLGTVTADPDYAEFGRTKPRLLRADTDYELRAVFAKLAGEARDAGAGYAVVSQNNVVRDPLEFRTLATEEDRKTAPVLFIGLAALGAMLLGVMLTMLEHSRPLARFTRALAELANTSRDVDALKPADFGGAYKVLAAHVNDALDKAAKQSGHERGPADLASVLGPMGGESAMSAFAAPAPREEQPKRVRSVPSSGAASPKPLMKPLPSSAAAAPPGPAATQPSGAASSTASKGASTELAADHAPPPRNVFDSASGASEDSAARELAHAAGRAKDAKDIGLDTRDEGAADVPRAPRHDEVDAAAVDSALFSGNDAVPAAQASSRTLRNLRASRQGPPQAQAIGAAAPIAVIDEETEWRTVYADFIALKRVLGEPIDKLTYEKFRGTLQRNKDALVARHGCERVAFKVYEKDARAALKASPVK
ncbi:MAG: hypothetical protein EXR75_13930 [Myxococcales bacterium]|nr:hypothetical protein [Myxococcales bacterium]